MQVIKKQEKVFGHLCNFMPLPLLERTESISFHFPMIAFGRALQPYLWSDLVVPTQCKVDADLNLTNFKHYHSILLNQNWNWHTQETWELCFITVTIKKKKKSKQTVVENQFFIYFFFVYQMWTSMHLI